MLHGRGLSTDLRALLGLVAPLLSGHSDLAIGTRLARGARVSRSVRREVVSRTYNHILRVTLRARFSDAQCGFKAVRADVALRLLPDVRDETSFFDTELLVLSSAPASASARCRWTGSRIRTRAWTWSAPPSTTCVASRGWWPARR